jgi:hypothetical protein
MAWMTVPHHSRSTYRGDEKSEWFPPSIVQLEIGFRQDRKRDPHNYCGTVLKAVVDALVAVRLWPDDTPEWVGHRESILTKGLLTKVTLWPK